MATLQNIRNRSVLLLVAIGVALFGFVLTDALTNGSSWSSFTKNYVAKVNGAKVSRQEFEQKDREISQAYKNQGQSVDAYQSREAAWNDLLQEMLLNNQYQKLGISVSNDEVLDMYTGRFISPLAQQQLGDPKTQTYDRNRVEQVLKFINTPESSIDEKQRDQWIGYKNSILYLEPLMIAERKNSKYVTLLEKAMSPTHFEKELSAKESSSSYDFEYVYVPYSSIKDADLKISDQEVASYYKEHLEDFKVEASREIKYISFPLVPSTEDQRNVEVKVGQIAADFKQDSLSGDENFITLNSEDKVPGIFLRKDQVAEQYQDAALSSPVGTVFTPSFDKASSKWTITKIEDRRMLPDSIRASVVRLAPTAADVDMATYTARLDSVTKIVRKTDDLTALAKLSMEQEKVDYGWMKPGQIIDSCFLGKKGDVFIVHLQNNQVAIIKVAEQSKPSEHVKLAQVTKSVNYSSETQRNTYNLAAKFMSSATTPVLFDTTATKENLYLRAATIAENDYQIAGLGNCRELIKWAYTSKVGAISDIQEVEDNLVVAYVAKENEEGYEPLANVQTAIKMALLRKKRNAKCIEELKTAMGTTPDMASTASALKVSVARASGVSMSNPTITDIGNEPVLPIAATYAALNKVVGPIAGSTGAFVIRVTNKTALPDAAQINQQNEMRYDQMNKYMISRQLIGALTKVSTVVDNRSRFY